MRLVHIYTAHEQTCTQKAQTHTRIGYDTRRHAANQNVSARTLSESLLRVQTTTQQPHPPLFCWTAAGRNVGGVDENATGVGVLCKYVHIMHIMLLNARIHANCLHTLVCTHAFCACACWFSGVCVFLYVVRYRGRNLQEKKGRIIITIPGIIYGGKLI